jgi:hypothetical protein
LLLPTPPTPVAVSAVTRYTLYLSCYSLLQLTVAGNAVTRVHFLPPSVASLSSNYMLLAILLQCYSLYLYLLLLPPPTTFCWQCCYKITLSPSTCSFSLLQLPVAGSATTRILSLPPPVASPSFNYLLLAMLLGEYTLYLHLLLLPPSTTCCWQCCYNIKFSTSTCCFPSSNYLVLSMLL